jgi:membrane protease YdiL (CAAX protease family)
MLKRKPLLIFFLLAFILSWYPWVISLIRNTGNSGPNPLGVLVAAIIVTAATQGRTGIKDLFSRMVKWRVRLSWYALVIILPAILSFLAAFIVIRFTGAIPDYAKLPGWKAVVEQFIFVFLFIGLGEEPGWRGFALEHLQVKHSPVKSSLLLAPVWTLWHLPLMGNEFAASVVPAFIVNVFAATFVLTWLYNSTGRSILLAMLFHAAVNTIGAGTIFPLFTAVDHTILWYVYSALWGAVAIAVVFSLKSAYPLTTRVVKNPSGKSGPRTYFPV